MKIMEIEEFALESVKETFDGRIVGRVTGAAHALLNSDRGAKGSELARGELRALIRMKN